ncbi:hypothetical protein [Radiobacillus deserti]|uniref:DUF3221 domain-containing protein n=1 Tax=Radiobacillus deserti TaxID=2594883 RepID=A0A516KJG1_9BACI|nr:hypothetical protein [Radiobacillus deserti]QDP41528.1 hypothetical protein FN924_15915 [Radiobacillus deserti]
MKKLILFILISTFLILSGCKEGEFIPVEAIITDVKSEDKLTIKVKEDGYDSYLKLINISKLSIDRKLKEGTEIRLWLSDRHDDVSVADEEKGAFPNKIEIISEG